MESDRFAIFDKRIVNDIERQRRRSRVRRNRNAAVRRRKRAGRDGIVGSGDRRARQLVIDGRRLRQVRRPASRHRKDDWIRWRSRRRLRACDVRRRDVDRPMVVICNRRRRASIQ